MDAHCDFVCPHNSATVSMVFGVETQLMFRKAIIAGTLLLSACGGGPDPLAPQTCQERVDGVFALLHYENAEVTSYEFSVRTEYDVPDISLPEGLRLAFADNVKFALTIDFIGSNLDFSDALPIKISMEAPPIYGMYAPGAFSFHHDGHDASEPFLVMDAVARNDTGAEVFTITKVSTTFERAPALDMYIDGGATVATNAQMAPFTGWLLETAPDEIAVDFSANSPRFSNDVIASFIMPAPEQHAVRTHLRAAYQAAVEEYDRGRCFPAR